MIGARIHRREDPRLISGHGRYVDDMTLPGMAHMTVVRSPYAHAKILSIDLSEAKKAPGVHAIYTYADFKGHISGGLPVSASFVAEKKYVPNQFPIAHDEVVYQGEPVAVVLADERGQAADAASLVKVDYEPLPAVMDIEKALEPKGSPTVHMGAPDNIGWDLTYSPVAMSTRRLKRPMSSSKSGILQQRLFPIAMEGRGVVAEYDNYDKHLTLWTSSQIPHFVRLFVGTACGLAESQVRVIAGPDVGGGFGSKIRPYPEEYLASIASKLAYRPVKWVEGRSENLVQATHHGRGQIFDIEVAAKKDGTLVGFKVTQYLDLGGYQGVFGAFQAVACLLSGGAYKWKHIAARTVGVLTNKTSTDAYRGAGRPEATHLVERAVDLVAREIGMDPVEVRRKNFATEFPFTNNFGLVYDSGNYDGTLDKALELANYKDLRREQEALRKQGRYLGIGLSTWIEVCGFGPSAITGPAAGVALVESSQVRIHPTGGVSVYVGTHSHGQGPRHHVCSDRGGHPRRSVRLDRRMHHGDTAEGPAVRLWDLRQSKPARRRQLGFDFVP